MPRVFVSLLTIALHAAGIGSALAADQPRPDTRTIAPEEAMAILGHVVDGQDGKDVGRVVDVLVAPDGTPQAAVLDVGGFLGVGNRIVSVAWDALRFDPAAKEHQITTRLTPDQIRAAPEYQGAAKPAVIVIAPSKN